MGNSAVFTVYVGSRLGYWVEIFWSWAWIEFARIRGVGIIVLNGIAII